MAGIYLHIPFCKKACLYCNFHFSTSLQFKNELVEALLKEIKIRKDYAGKEKIDTIYLGGGTPSLLTPAELNAIFHALRHYFPVDAHAEITLEANPDDIDFHKLKRWQAAGINRLSIGVQSFFNEHLAWMNRAHTASQAVHSIKLAQEQGFHNITIDLIYGIPGLSDEQWEQNVEKATSLGIPHLSCYALTVEPKTALENMIRKHKVQAVNSEDQARQFHLLLSWMEEVRYEHYEISNFAAPGYRSRHNSSYWQGKTYLGIGPSAHSFDGRTRQWNIANNALYIKSLEQQTLPFEEEILTPDQQLNEYIMIGLRTIEGISLEKVEEMSGAAEVLRLQNQSKKYISAGKMQTDHNRLYLTREGKLFADGIAADLFKI